MAIHLIRGPAKSLALALIGLSVAGSAHAILPLIIGVVAATAMGVGAVSEVNGWFTPITPNMSHFVGQKVLYATIKDSDGNAVAVPLGGNPANAPSAPLAPATAVPGAAGAIDSAHLCGRHALGDTGGYGFVEDCQSCFTNYGQYPGNSCLDLTTAAEINAVTQAVSCAAGYSYNGSTCALTNARQVTDDKRCDVLLSSGQFSTASDLNCSDTSDGTKASALLRDGKVVAYGTDSAGNPLVFTAAPSTTVGSSDWVTVSVSRQVQVGNQSQIESTTLQIDPATSTLMSVSSSNTPGSISVPSGGGGGSGGGVPTGQPSGGTNGSNTPVVTTRPGEQAVQPDTGSHCGAAGEPACAMDDSAFSGAPRSWEGKELPVFDASKEAIEGHVDPSFDWSALRPSLLPGSAISCHPLEFRALVASKGLDATTTLDLCPYFDFIRGFLGYIFFITTAMYLWRKFMGTEDPTAKRK